MNLFSEIVKEFLIEEVMKDDVENAIDNRNVILMTYTPKGDSNATGKRKICPVALGLTKKGELVIRAFQEDGDSHTYRKGWKFFIADNVDTWEKTDEVFNPDELQGINKGGDISMAKVLKVIDGYPNDNMPTEKIGSNAETKGNVGINDIVNELPLDQRTPDTIARNNNVTGPVDIYNKSYNSDNNVYNSEENQDNLYKEPAGVPQNNAVSHQEKIAGIDNTSNTEHNDKPVTVVDNNGSNNEEEKEKLPGNEPVTEI